jgi:hypothetical protein
LGKSWENGGEREKDRGKNKKAKIKPYNTI